MNLCGECNVCCSALRIDKDEIHWKYGDKAAGQPCEKLENGQCSIYKERPGTCKRYECLWLQLSKKVDGVALNWRPDNLGILVSTKLKEDGKLHFNIKELHKGAFDLNNITPQLDGFLSVLFKLTSQQKEECVVIIYLYGEDKGHPLKQNIGG